jgi:hypothetical protein
VQHPSPVRPELCRARVMEMDGMPQRQGHRIRPQRPCGASRPRRALPNPDRTLKFHIFKTSERSNPLHLPSMGRGRRKTTDMFMSKGWQPTPFF